MRIPWCSNILVCFPVADVDFLIFPRFPPGRYVAGFFFRILLWRGICLLHHLILSILEERWREGRKRQTNLSRDPDPDQLLEELSIVAQLSPRATLSTQLIKTAFSLLCKSNMDFSYKKIKSACMVTSALVASWILNPGFRTFSADPGYSSCYYFLPAPDPVQLHGYPFLGDWVLALLHR